MFPFYTPWKHQKAFRFLAFSKGIKGNIGQQLVKKHKSYEFNGQYMSSMTWANDGIVLE